MDRLGFRVEMDRLGFRVEVFVSREQGARTPCMKFYSKRTHSIVREHIL